jgi:hypothetical protein
MFRKYVIVTLALMMCLGTTSCTSKKAEGDDVEVASGGDDALEEADATENNSDLDADTSAAPSDVAASDDLGGEVDDLAGGGDEQAAVADNAAGDVTANELDAAPPADPAAGDSSAPPADAGAGDLAAAEPTPDPEVAAPPEPVASEPPPIEEPGASPVPEPTTEAPVAATGGLLKVKSAPEKMGRTLVNGIYIAREGDTVESIAQKIGVKEKDICKVNSFNCSRPAKVGDKYYYNSPQRPTDETAMKTFYEDAGLQPEVYTARAGDNIRKVGKELLGHDRSWMELWSLNDVESKGDLDEGTQLKYWPKTDVAAPAMASNEEAPPAPAAEAAPPVEAPPMDAGAPPPPPAEEMAAAPPPPPPPDQQMAQNDLPPGPDPNAAGSVEPPPPPPPPPPPGDAPPADPTMASMDNMAQDPDQTMMLGVGAVLFLAAAALFISIRKKRARRQIDFNTTTQTQIE